MYKDEDRDNQFGYIASFVLILGVIYINNSLMFEELYSATFRGVATIMLFAIVFIVNTMTVNDRWKVSIDQRILNFYFLASVCSLLSIIVNGINFEFDVYALLQFTIAFGISSVISRDMFYRVYVDIMSVIALCGIVCFLLYGAVPSLFSVFPVYLWHGDILIKNCIICAIPISMQNYRNFGIFREPGMFSTFLVFALFIEMFINKPNIKKVVVLFATLLTTLSTNGYICAILLLVAFFTTSEMKSNPYVRGNQRKIFFSLVGLIIAGIAFLRMNSQARLFLLDKLNEITVGDSVNNTTSGSGYERYRAVIYAFQAFMSDPLFGIGHTGWQEKFSNIIGTATPINWFGLRGIIYGFMMNWFYFKNGFGLDRQVCGISTKVLVCVLLLCNILSQNVSGDMVMYLLIMYQCVNDRKTNSEKEQIAIYEAN